MNLVYDSMTGNTKAFALKLAEATGLPCYSLEEWEARTPWGAFLLLTYTYGKGAVPEPTRTFLGRHHEELRGVVSSGSFHWGATFGEAARLISSEYNVPVVAIVNKRGSAADIQQVGDWLRGQLNAKLDRTEQPGTVR